MSALSGYLRIFNKNRKFVRIFEQAANGYRVYSRPDVKFNLSAQLQFKMITTSFQPYNKETVENKNPVVDYDYVKKAINQEQNVIIDVREPDELTKHGKIPSSVNIPLGNVKSALQLPEEEFKKLYKISKPTKLTELIFYCMIGKRSASAQNEAITLGYTNSKNYQGSFKDWDTNEKKK